MPVNKRQVKEVTYEMTNTCDKCGDGVMECTTNISLATLPALHPHVCSKCGHKQNFREIYPYIERGYEEV